MGALDRRDLPRTHRGDDAGPQQRRLAAARGADDGEQPAGDEPRDRVRGDVLAAEVEAAVVRLEGRQAAVRALRRRERGRDAGAAECADALRAADALET